MTEEEKNKKRLGPVVWLVPLIVGLGLTMVYFTGVVNTKETAGGPVDHITRVEQTKDVVPSQGEVSGDLGDETGVGVDLEKNTESIQNATDQIVLDPQQQAQADTMLANFEGKPIGELRMVYGALTAASSTVPEYDRAVLEYVLLKLGLYIAEQEGINE